MNLYKAFSLFFLRISLGLLFFYAGIVKVLNPSWSAAGYLTGAKTFSGLYQWMISPEVLPVVNFLNEWGLTLIGISLIFGVGVRLSAPLGALLMLLYYFPVLHFPYIGSNSFLVDEHIIYAFAFLVLAAANAGRIWGLEGRLPLFRRLFS
jgi:thiosulfate dehydrogenase (quinone) large subunit